MAFSHEKFQRKTFFKFGVEQKWGKKNVLFTTDKSHRKLSQKR